MNGKDKIPLWRCGEKIVDDDIAPCCCGMKAIYDHIDTNDICVRCTRENIMYCWSGPVLGTKKEAIEAWNSIMTAKKVRDEQ